MPLLVIKDEIAASLSQTLLDLQAVRALGLGPRLITRGNLSHQGATEAGFVKCPRLIRLSPAVLFVSARAQPGGIYAQIKEEEEGEKRQLQGR